MCNVVSLSFGVLTSKVTFIFETYIRYGTFFMLKKYSKCCVFFYKRVHLR